MQRLLFCAILAAALSLIATPIVLPWLRRKKFGQSIYTLGPSTHKSKQDTPTMGGIIFILGMVAVPLLLHRRGTPWTHLPMCLFGILGFGAIGFVDDYIKISRKRSEGLTAKQKMALSILFALIMGIWAARTVGTTLRVPFSGYVLDLGWFYVPCIAFVIVAVVNSANLLDGCDGLLAGCSMVDFAALAVLCILFCGVSANPGLYNLATVACACSGALLGFLRVNAHPAKVFMGDTGAFAIGGAISALAVCSGLALLLPIICIAMLCSSLSDIIQVLYCNMHKGKRLFKMTPLQHHFELSGMHENHVVVMYWIATILVCLLALAGYAA